MGFAPRQLPLLVASALKRHVLPIELSAAITAFPAVLRDLGARLVWSDPDKRPAVVAGRFSCALNALGTLDALLCDPKPRLHIKAPVKVLQLWLNSSDVAGPIVYTVVPVAAAFGVAPVAGVPDETRSGVAALVNYFHERNDSM